MTEQRNLTTVPKPQDKDVALRKVREQSLALSGDRDMYSVGGGKKAPSAHLVREMAKLEEIPIKLEIVRIWKHKDQCGVIMRGWKGERDNPIIEFPGSVIHNFQLTFLESVLDAIANGLSLNGRRYLLGDEDWQIGENGEPIILNRSIQIQLLRNHLNKVKFSERDAITKCERTILLKLMGKYDDWGDRDEEKILESHQEREPETLEEYRTAIRALILSLTNNDGEKAQNLLIELSQEMEFPAIRKTSAIENIEQAQEILARARQKEIDVRKMEE